MCELARAIAMAKGPKAIGPLLGYSVTTEELKKLYSRNGFQNLDLVTLNHIEIWIYADMAFRHNENIFFYLNRNDLGSRSAYEKLEELKAQDKTGLTVVGWMP